MPVGVGKVLFDDWKSLEFPDGWSDTFIFQMSPKAGLPPADYARVIRKLVPAVCKLRKSASIWVQVRSESGDGNWFIQVVRHTLRGLPAPVAVTSGSVQPQIWDFSVYPWLACQPLPRPAAVKSYLDGRKVRPSELGCLRVLARANCAYAKEIASLTGLSLTGVRSALRTLEEGRLVRSIGERRRPFWRICRTGISIALRSWGLPPGYAFPNRKERGWSACKERITPRRKHKRSSAGRHRLTARLWPAWLRKAWPQAEVWAGWTEVPCGYKRPDSLCWGILDGVETLFWLEVESGNKSRQEICEKTIGRVNHALVYARGYSVRLAFILLGPPWVRRETVKVFSDLPDDLAVVLEDWKAFGELPVPAWGIVRWA